MKSRQVGSVTVLQPMGYLTGGDETSELEQTIRSAAEAGNKALVINLAAVQHVNSTALGVLISAHENHVRRGGAVYACELHEGLPPTAEDVAPGISSLPAGRVNSLAIA